MITFFNIFENDNKNVNNIDNTQNNDSLEDTAKQANKNSLNNITQTQKIGIAKQQNPTKSIPIQSAKSILSTRI